MYRVSTAKACVGGSFFFFSCLLDGRVGAFLFFFVCFVIVVIMRRRLDHVQRSCLLLTGWLPPRGAGCCAARCGCLCNPFYQPPKVSHTLSNEDCPQKCGCACVYFSAHCSYSCCWGMSCWRAHALCYSRFTQKARRTAVLSHPAFPGTKLVFHESNGHHDLRIDQIDLLDPNPEVLCTICIVQQVQPREQIAQTKRFPPGNMSYLDKTIYPKCISPERST